MSVIHIPTAAEIALNQGLSHPDKVRFFLPENGGWRPVYWRTYLSDIAALSIFLRERGVQADVKGAVYANTCYEWACAGMAIQGSGGALVPIYPSNTADQVSYVLDHSDSQVCFLQSAYLKNLAAILPNLKLLKTVILMDVSQEQKEKYLSDAGLVEEDGVEFFTFEYIHSKISRGDSDPIEAYRSLVSQICQDQIGQILYTSGTTGNPKGVELSHRNVGINGDDWLSVLGEMIPETRVDLLWLPLSHIFGWGEIGLGNSLLFETYLSDPKSVLSQMPKIRPTVFMSVPAYWEKLYIQAGENAANREERIENLKKLVGGRLAFCLSGGAGLKQEVKEFYLEAGMLLIEGYGLTECSPTLTMNSRDAFDFATVGRPFPSVEVKLAPDGEILAKGPNVFHGYYKNPQASAEAFDRDGWFMTGDLGEFTSDGFLKIVGRKKDILVTAGGKNISPQLIEQRFADSPIIEHIVLYGNEKKYLTALVSLRREAVLEFAKNSGLEDLSFENLADSRQVQDLVQGEIDQVNGRVASYESIKKFWILPHSLSVESGQLTPSLKIRRMAIHKEFKEEYENLYQ